MRLCGILPPLVIAGVLLLIPLAGCGGGSPAADGVAAEADHPGAAAADLLGAQAADALAALAAPPGVDPALFARIKAEFVRAVAAGGSKHAAGPPVGEWNEVKDFRLVEDPPGTYYLEWTYVNTGDNDLNSEVNISDLTPIGLYFGAKLGDAEWDEAQAADADGNGEVNISDVSGVGANYLSLVTEYRIYQSASIEDHPARSGGENGPGAGLLGIVGYSGPAGASAVRTASAAGKVTLSYALSGGPGTNYYWVRPAGKAADPEGASSIAGGGDPAELPQLALTNPPALGTGSMETPYRLAPGVGYAFTLTDPLAGDVTAFAETEFIASDRYAGSFADGVFTPQPYYAGQFFVSATYRDKPAQWATVVHCSAEGAATANDEWLMFGHDPQRTGRSPYRGPRTNELAWDYNTARSVMYSGPVIGPDGTVYVGSGLFGGDCELYALNADGSLKWAYQTNYTIEWCCPAVGPDGTVYVGDFGHRLHAVSPDGIGSVLYRADAPYHGSPVLGGGGTIYIASGNKLLAISPAGTLDWDYTTGDNIRGGPALSPGGTLYIGSDDGHLHAVIPGGGQKWAYDTSDKVRSTPAVGPDGTVYFANDDYKLYALEPDGGLEWVYSFVPLGFSDENPVKSSPALGVDGTVYVGVPRASTDTTLGSVHAVWADGTRRWVTYLPGEVYSSPALGADGTLYVGTEGGGIYALNPDGSELWQYLTFAPVFSSPAISADGLVCVGCANGVLYAFGSMPGV